MPVHETPAPNATPSPRTLRFTVTTSEAQENIRGLLSMISTASHHGETVVFEAEDRSFIPSRRESVHFLKTSYRVEYRARNGLTVEMVKREKESDVTVTIKGGATTLVGRISEDVTPKLAREVKALLLSLERDRDRKLAADRQKEESEANRELGALLG